MPGATVGGSHDCMFFGLFCGNIQAARVLVTTGREPADY
jgi:hypothetical protein